MDAALEAMPPGRLILTVNRRLALELKGHYDRTQAEQGYQAWESAVTLSWSDWMASLFRDLVDHGVSGQILLTPHQSRILWEQIIRYSDHANNILKPSGAAMMASKAWGLMQAWNIGTEQISEAATAETELFLAWFSEFQRRCRRERWLDAALLPNLIAQRLREGGIMPPTEIILAGFDEITPQQQSILDLLQEEGCRVSFLTSPDYTNTAVRIQAEDVVQELEIAASWALRRLQQNSEARIGVVVPQLAELRTRAEATFKRCFHPGSILPGSNNPPQAYNISLGVPLNQCPLVVDAFLILQLATGELQYGDLSRLLRSPFLSGGSVEKQIRARLDAYLRSRVGERTMSLDTLIRNSREFSNGEDNSCSIMLQALDSFRLRLDHLPVKQSPQQWIDEFNILFNLLGWPRYARLNSTEYQQAECFKQAMSSFRMLGRVQGSMGLFDAIGTLQTLVGEVLFQPKGEAAAVQILGILEASGLRFDHLWVMGLSDDRWPASAMPNPLLPISLQRKLNLPHASPSRELEFSAAITAKLLASAPEVVISHAASDGESALRVSRLVAKIPLSSLDKLDLAPITGVCRVGFGSTQLERIVDNLAPALAPGSHLSGGSGLLSDQSACPFRAFAKHRLGARPVEDPVSGMDARIKGVMIHRILQKFWEKTGTQARLLNMVDTELRQQVADLVRQELSRLTPSRPETLVPRFLQIEQERVTELILKWLQLEKERAPFGIVSLEQKETVELGGLKLSIVADRVDRLQDGTNLIIDYKTGKLHNKGWFEERIEEPQLPLYATANRADVAGVFLAGVSRATMKFAGAAKADGLVPGVKAYNSGDTDAHAAWDSLLSDWGKRLELLAAEVREGRAEVTPTNRNKDCIYCPLPALCRIHEQEDFASGAGE